MPRSRGGDAPDPADACELIEQLGDFRHFCRVPEDLEIDHRPEPNPWRPLGSAARVVVSSGPTKGSEMSERSLEELGPVDYLVVEFPAGASNFTGEMAKELVALVDAGTIRLIDVLILTKDEDGTIDAMELSDIEELGELEALESELAELLAAEDVVHLA